MKKVMLTITGMGSEHCENTVKSAIDKTGAMAESVSHKSGQAVACFNSQQLKDEVVVNSINATGQYKVTGCKEC